MGASRRSRLGSPLLAGVVAMSLVAATLAGCSSPMPVFEVGDVEVSAAATEVHAGDDVEITARVANTGTGPGTYDAVLLVDGEPASRQSLVLEPGEETTVRFMVTAGPSGSHEIAVGSSAATLRVMAAPVFEVRDLRLAADPPEILAGDPLEYVAEVANVGDAPGSYEAELAVDGAVRMRNTVDLGPGSSTVVRFALEAGEPGSHLVAFGDRRAYFTVLTPAVVAVTGLALSPNPAVAKDDLTAAVTVANDGGASGTIMLNVRVDGKVARKHEVTVAGGESRTFDLALDVPAPGRHTVSVGDVDKRLLVWKITRPANGKVMVNKIKGGYGQLKVKNGDPEQDCVVVLAAKAKPSKALLAVYVRARRSTTVKGLKDGTYVAYFTHGERWDAVTRAFTAEVDKRRFADPIRFKTTRTATSIRYKVWTLALHQAGGDAPTDPVPDEDFPSVP
jgi:hypothetical protein